MLTEALITDHNKFPLITFLKRMDQKFLSIIMQYPPYLVHCLYLLQGATASRPCAEAVFNYDGKDPG